LAVFADAARGLWAAHQKGLVHRDFKPENVLVAQDGRAKVTDFGLARESDSWLRERQADEGSSTELYAPTRGLVGTPAYMAPELFEGGPATPASDQFALCVALFVALFDKHPFKAGEGIALSELVTRVRGGTLQRPAFQGTSHGRLFGVLQRGLAASPAARFSDMPELLAALQGAAGKRRRGVTLAFSLLAVLLLGALGWRFFTAFVPTASHSASRATSAKLARGAPSAAAALPPTPVVPAPEASAAPAATASFGSVPSPARAPAGAPSERHRPPKPTDVRYKDWLKDPF
jgi:serine/threonine protein kinase